MYTIPLRQKIPPNIQHVSSSKNLPGDPVLIRTYKGRQPLSLASEVGPLATSLLVTDVTGDHTSNKYQ